MVQRSGVAEAGDGRKSGKLRECLMVLVRGWEAQTSCLHCMCCMCASLRVQAVHKAVSALRWQVVMLFCSWVVPMAMVLSMALVLS